MNPAHRGAGVVRSARARVGGFVSGWLWIAAVASAACVPGAGGFDVGALHAVEPQLEAISGQRIQDLSPFPALVGDRLLLVVCRFPTDSSVPVSGSGLGWRPDWAQPAVAAVDAALPEISLAWHPDLGTAGIPEASAAGASPPSIRIVSVANARAASPVGLADTLVECDVGPRVNGRGRAVSGEAASLGVRGQVVSAEVRMRTSRRDPRGYGRPVSQAAWTGALMHELGHALGFAGHVATGASLLVRDEQRLRAFGQRAVEGASVIAPSLRALYSIEPGRVLGHVEATEAGRAAISSARARVAEIEGRSGPAAGPFASVGDRSARLVWRWPAGETVELRFPDWSRRVRNGLEIIVRSSHERTVAESESPARSREGAATLVSAIRR